MVNSELFIKRLEKILNFYQFSASAFADKIGVQRSSMSHLLSGRNKPSLDFVMKLLHTFEDVTIEWLIDGKGAFPKTETPPTLQTKNNTENIILPIEKNNTPEQTIAESEKMINQVTSKKTIEKINKISSTKIDVEFLRNHYLRLKLKTGLK